MFKVFIENQFKAVDINSDGTVGLDEYRQDVTTSSFVSIIDEMVVCIINICNIDVCTAGDHILTVFIKTYSAVTVDVNSLELVLNEDLEHGRECIIGLANTVDLDS